jgi:tetratricopeptide (TPR) repeat protein
MNEPTDMPYELESLLRADGDGPAPRIDAVSAQRLVAQAIDGAAAPRVAPLRIKRYAWLLAAALVITGSAAAMYSALQTRSDTAHSGRPVVARKSPAPPASVEPAARPPPPATAEATVPAETRPARAGTAPATAQPRAEQPAAADHGGAGVQDLLRRANALRGEGRYRSAERTYMRVVAQSPSGAPAYSARVAAAGLRIERLNDPRGALKLYSEALRAEPHGALAPEIHEGMAQAFRKLGQPAREREALNALLREQADGPTAERARARLQELDGAGR